MIYCSKNMPLFFVMLIVMSGMITRGMSMDEDQLDEKVDALAEELLTCKDMVGFSLGIVQNGQKLMTKGYGLANIEKELPVTEHTLFGIASMTKAFTSTLLLHLLDKHSEYTLDTPVRVILGSDLHFITCQLTKHATLRDLMSHRTGMLPSNRARMQDDLNRDTLLKKLRIFETKYDFRSTYKYNNMMYGLLSKVTEVLGGDSWENLIRKHIFDPLGMNSSTFTHETDLNNDNIALAYMRNWRENFEWRPISQRLHSHWGQIGGSGSILSNAADLIKWLQFQLSLGKDEQGNQVMSESVVAQTQSPIVVIPEDNCETCAFYRKPYLNVTYMRNMYGLGWRIGVYRGERLVTHTGSSFGYTGMISLLPDSDIAVHTSITGTDKNFEGRRALHAYIMDLLLGVEPQVTLENACKFPYYDRNTTQQQTDTSFSDKLSSSPQTVDLETVQLYVGTYGHFGFGNVTVFYNRSLQRLQMTYGNLGLWDLFQSEEEHRFVGIGRDDIKDMVLDPLVFHRSSMHQNEDSKMVRLTVSRFEPEYPPVFERRLQYADAPAPGLCDVICGGGNRVEKSYWITLSIFICILTHI